MVNSLYYFCCNIMHGVADVFNCTYLEANVFCFYILQPIIYTLLAIEGNMYLKTQNNHIAKLTSFYGMICIFIQIILLISYVGANLQELGSSKIFVLTEWAYLFGISHATIRIVLFIVIFLATLIIARYMNKIKPKLILYIKLSAILNTLYFILLLALYEGN